MKHPVSVFVLGLDGVRTIIEKLPVPGKEGRERQFLLQKIVTADSPMEPYRKGDDFDRIKDEKAKEVGDMLMYSIKRLWTVLSLAFFLVLAIGTNLAYAHAGMMGSSPQDGELLKTNPGQISVRFTETLEPDLVTIRLFDWDGKEIQMQRPTLQPGDASQVNAQLPANLAEGTYSVIVSVVSEDGHPVEERLTFSIGQKSAVVVPPGENKTDTNYLIVYRYLAQGIILLGGGLYLIAAWGQRYGLPKLAALIGMGRQIGWTLAIVGLIFLWFLYDESLKAVSLTDALLHADSNLLMQSPFAVMLIVSFILLLFLAIPGMVSGWYAGIWVLVISAQAFGGHAWGIAPVWLSIALRLLHVLTVALWLGALIYLLLVSKEAERGNEPFKRFFLRLVATAAVLAVVTGVLMLLVQTDVTSILASSLAWNYLLYGKIVSVIIMLALAYRQTKRWRGSNQLQRKWLRWEIVFGIVAVLAGLWMSQTNYPTDATNKTDTTNTQAAYASSDKLGGFSQ
ncbi:copper resistance CopC/CopD family protein [Brevibacillus parabrevis]|uniref:copper resistance CopC/CopD family protein n=1 Tax=Brevibacillus parabrevis TaxID=54914 RepID=UPI000AD3E24C|nr:copper resistance protein CopC [Brevibacillus parabrevis]